VGVILAGEVVRKGACGQLGRRAYRYRWRGIALLAGETGGCVAIGALAAMQYLGQEASELFSVLVQRVMDGGRMDEWRDVLPNEVLKAKLSFHLRTFQHSALLDHVDYIAPTSQHI
jgi:hypothetical protein